MNQSHNKSKSWWVHTVSRVHPALVLQLPLWPRPFILSLTNKRSTLGHWNPPYPENLKRKRHNHGKVRRSPPAPSLHRSTKHLFCYLNRVHNKTKWKDVTTASFQLGGDFTPRSCRYHVAEITRHTHAKSKETTSWQIKTSLQKVNFCLHINYHFETPAIAVNLQAPWHVIINQTHTGYWPSVVSPVNTSQTYSSGRDVINAAFYFIFWFTT